MRRRGERMKRGREVVFKIVQIVGLLAVILYIGYFISVDVYNYFVNSCNEKYGVDGWEMIEITGTEEAPWFFIGQTWKCVKLP